jgi:signal transduction histidine kinase
LTVLADEIRSLNPEQTEHRVAVPEGASSEIAVIAEAINGYNKRIDSFIEREREFINMASHELRTPLSIIAGAVDLTLKEQGLSDAVINRLIRAQNTISDVNELIVLLLVLAKNPERLVSVSEPVALHELVPQIVDELSPLAKEKGLSMQFGECSASDVVAPPQMMQSAIANLIRNAIEHTHSGTVRIDVHSDASIVITNPAEAISALELSRLYSQLARGSGRDGGGIGLALIARLCRHCGWNLSISDQDGIHISLAFGPSPSR